MKEIFEMVSTVLLSLGGGGVIVMGMSSWLGKVWANRILEDEKKKHQKEIEDYKSQLTEKINHLNVINEKALHISKVQYDTEFNIYKEIWGKLFTCIINTNNLYPSGMVSVPTDEKELEEYNDKKYKLYMEAYKEFSITIDTYAPFYKEEFYNKFLEVRNLCVEKGNIFHTYVYDVPYNQTFALVRDSKITGEERKRVYIEIPAELKVLQDSLRKEIREYLLSLEVK
ncbi:hypothetical protein [Romboutsia sp. 1001713B170207_170306_H8]|uniref:hypothetical protein n=1 Tax=Romboutsia sp. 1001713B170207_170306_H8 TaxID=2787112 RepID=UPI001898975E|nr:hypothetical protein [Romboutsia sp. 1001713B170207_170306_H8]